MKEGILKKIPILFFLALFALPVYSQQQEQITITTYYPSPTGSYNELSTNIFTLSPQRNRPAGEEGRIYYDNSTKTIFYYNGTEWIELGGGAELLLGKLEKSLDYNLLNTTEWRKIYSWAVTGPNASAITDANGTYALKIDLSSFGRGLYEIAWGGQVAIDAIDDRYVQLKLQTHGPGGDWVTIDQTEQFEDDDGALNGAYTTHSIEQRTVTLPLKQRTYQAFRIIARKSGGNTRAMATVKAGTHIVVTRVSSF